MDTLNPDIIVTAEVIDSLKAIRRNHEVKEAVSSERKQQGPTNINLSEWMIAIEIKKCLEVQSRFIESGLAEIFGDGSPWTQGDYEKFFNSHKEHFALVGTGEYQFMVEAVTKMAGFQTLDGYLAELQSLTPSVLLDNTYSHRVLCAFGLFSQG